MRHRECNSRLGKEPDRQGQPRMVVVLSSASLPHPARGCSPVLHAGPPQERRRLIRRCFDEAWSDIAGNFGNDPSSVEAARTKLAKVILGLAHNDATDATRMRCGSWHSTPRAADAPPVTFRSAKKLGPVARGSVFAWVVQTPHASGQANACLITESELVDAEHLPSIRPRHKPTSKLPMAVGCH